MNSEFASRCVRVAVTVGFSAILVAGMVVGTSWAADAKKKTDNKKPTPMAELKKVDQGHGYWEKIDPNVDYKDRLPRILPCKSADSVKRFEMPKGYEIETVVAEPLCKDAVDMCFDENGRMYVCELMTYAEKPFVPVGSVSLLDDVDGDGKYEKSTVFADKLSWPVAALPYDGGIFVACAPDILYLKDTDGDGKADIREIVVSGFKVDSVNAFPNSLRWGLDGRVHVMTSTRGGTLVAERWNKSDSVCTGKAAKIEPISTRVRDISFDPRSGHLRLESGGSQHGTTFDAWNRKFNSSNSAPINMVMYDERYLAQNPYLAPPSINRGIWKTGSKVYRISPLEPWRKIRCEMRDKKIFKGGSEPVSGYYTSACGVTVYTGNAMPELVGHVFVCEGAGNLVSHMTLKPDGVGFGAYRVEKETEFLRSDEIWFRPVQFAHGPDGALYLADMYREIYEIPDGVPASVQKHIDLRTGNTHGRVYRIKPTGFKRPQADPLGKKTTDELVGLLTHPNSWHRRTAARLLQERQDAKAVAPLKKLAAQSKQPLARMHALWALFCQKALSADVVLPRLDDKNPRVREHAVRLSEEFLKDSPALRKKLCSMTADEDLRVRYQLAFTLGGVADAQATAALAAIARRDADEDYMRFAVLSSCFGRAGDIFAIAVADSRWRESGPAAKMLAELAEQAGRQKKPDQVKKVLANLDKIGDGEKKLIERIVRGLGNGLLKSGTPIGGALVGNRRATKAMAKLVAEAKGHAADTKSKSRKRIEAIRALTLAPLEDVSDTLAELLESHQLQEIQIAAIQTLSRFQNDDVGEIIVEFWNGFTPKVRGEASEAMFARKDRLMVLFAALEDETIAPSQLDPARIEYLLKHPDKAVKAKAQELLGGVKLARRDDVVNAYRESLKLKRNVAHGKKVFKKECSICHRLENEGYDLGLPLQTVQNRGEETILLAVVDPNRDVQPQYLNYVVITNDGRSVTGMIGEESANSITLKRAEGESDTVLRADIDEMQNTGMSIMPEGLEKQLSKQDVADIIGYLMTIK